MQTQMLSDLRTLPSSVLLRADLNVPLKNETILCDHRLQSILPTINLLLHNQCGITIITHLGRPQGIPTRNLSTKILIPWFRKRGYDIEHQTLEARERSPARSQIVMLENLRFYYGEQQRDELFAQRLLDHHNLFVQDAFGSLHDQDTSITLLPKEFSFRHRTFGLLVEKELSQLSILRTRPKSPFALIIGGNKLASKLPLLERFINKQEAGKPSAICIGGAIALPFLHAQGHCIGEFLLDAADFSIAKQLLIAAQKNNVDIILPKDVRYIFAHRPNNVLLCNANQIPTAAHVIDIGPQTIEAFASISMTAQTIFANGTMGIYTNTLYAHGTREVLRAIAESTAYSVVGGGDTVAAVYQAALEDDISFLSSGGGATLAYLACAQPEDLPGIAAML